MDDIPDEVRRHLEQLTAQLAEEREAGVVDDPDTELQMLLAEEQEARAVDAAQPVFDRLRSAMGWDLQLVGPVWLDDGRVDVIAKLAHLNTKVIVRVYEGENYGSGLALFVDMPNGHEGVYLDAADDDGRS